MANLEVKLSIADMPEILFLIRGELAKMLRNGAKGEEPRVAKRLKEIADAFEVGQIEVETD